MPITRRTFLAGMLSTSALALAACAVEQQWVTLGTAQVNLRNTFTIIPVTVQQGLFTSLRLQVSGSPVFINSLVVNFVSGEQSTLAVNTAIPAGGQTDPIFLPGVVRAIKLIQMNFRRVPTGGSATVTVQGSRI